VFNPRNYADPVEGLWKTEQELEERMANGVGRAKGHGAKSVNPRALQRSRLQAPSEELEDRYRFKDKVRTPWLFPGIEPPKQFSAPVNTFFMRDIHRIPPEKLVPEMSQLRKWTRLRQ